MNLFILFFLLFSTTLSLFLSRDFQSNYITLIPTYNSHYFLYTYHYSIPFQNPPLVIFGISGLQIRPIWNQISIQIKSVCSKDRTTNYFYTGNLQIYGLKIYLIAVDIHNINFIKGVQGNKWRMQQQLANGQGYRNIVYDMNFMQFDRNQVMIDELRCFTFLNSLNLYSKDHINFSINCSIVNNSTFGITTTVNGNTILLSYQFSYIIIDLFQIQSFNLNFTYSYITNLPQLENIISLQVSILGITGFQIQNFMQNFTILFQIQNYNCIRSDNVLFSNLIYLSFFTNQNLINSSLNPTIQYIQISTQVIGFVTLFIAFFINKMIGFQTISVLQISFFMLSTFDQVPKILNSYREYKTTINGYNQLFTDLQNLQIINFDQQYAIKQGNIKRYLVNIGYNVQFVKNVNYMLAINVILCIFGIISIKFNQYSRCFKFIGKDLAIGLLIFNILNYMVSIGIYVNEFKDYGYELNNLCILITILTLVYGIVAYVKCEKQVKQYWINLNIEYKYYPIYYLGNRLVIGFIVGFFALYEHIIIILISIQILYICYLIFNNPYENTLHKYRLIFNQILILLIYGVCLYYKNYTNKQNIDNTVYLQWFQLIVIFFGVVTNFLILFMQFCNKCYINQTQDNQQKMRKVQQQNDSKNMKQKIQNALVQQIKRVKIIQDIFLPIPNSLESMQVINFGQQISKQQQKVDIQNKRIEELVSPIRNRIQSIQAINFTQQQKADISGKPKQSKFKMLLKYKRKTPIHKK